MSDKPRAKCPSCGKAATRRISGGAGLVFKGTGFYITDYGKDGKGPRKEGNKPETAPKGETKSESTISSESTTSKPDAAPVKPESRSHGKKAK